MMRLAFFSGRFNEMFQTGKFGGSSHEEVLVFTGAGHFRLEVWPESHWPGFALRHLGVLQT